VAAAAAAAVTVERERVARWCLEKIEARMEYARRDAARELRMVARSIQEEFRL